MGLTPAGAASWATSLNVGLQAVDLAVAPGGSPHLLGTFSGAITLGGTTLTAKGNEDIFVWKVPMK